MDMNKAKNCDKASFEIQTSDKGTTPKRASIKYLANSAVAANTAHTRMSQSNDLQLWLPDKILLTWLA